MLGQREMHPRPSKVVGTSTTPWEGTTTHRLPRKLHRGQQIEPPAKYGYMQSVGAMDTDPTPID